MKRIISTILALTVLIGTFGVVYASADTYTIELSRHGNDGTEFILATIGKQLPESVDPGTPRFESELFGGYYYTSPTNGDITRIYNASGERVFHEPWDVAGNTQIVASWVTIGHNLKVYHHDGTDDYEYLFLGSRYSDLSRLVVIPQPQNPLYSFAGYFSQTEGRETQFYDGNGNVVFTESLPTNLRIGHAHYIQTRFPFVFDKNGGTGGTDEIILEMRYETAWSPSPLWRSTQFPEKITPPTRAGFVFSGYLFERNGIPTTAFRADGARVFNDVVVSVTGKPHETIKFEPFPIYALWRCATCDELECVCVYCEVCGALADDCICVPETEPPTSPTDTEPTPTIPTIPTDTTPTSPTNTIPTSPTDTTPTDTTPTTPSDTKTTPTSPTDTTPTSPTDTTPTTPSGTKTTPTDTTPTSPKPTPTSPTDTKSTPTTPTSPTNTSPSDETSPTEPQGNKVTFNPNNGEPVIVAVIEDGEVIGEFPQIVRAGFEFIEWAEIRDVGRVLGEDTIKIGDALQILRYLVKLSSVVKPDTDAWNAALIVSGCQECGSAATRGGLKRSEDARSCECKPQIADALQILRHLVKLSNVITDGVPVAANTIVTRDITVTARWAAIVPGAPGGFTAKSSARNVELSWNAVQWADGYEVYRSNEQLGEYKLIGTITSGTLTSFTDKSVRSGQWFYCVRAYRDVDGRRLFGEYGEVQGVSVK